MRKYSNNHIMKEWNSKHKDWFYQLHSLGRFYALKSEFIPGSYFPHLYFLFLCFLCTPE